MRRPLDREAEAYGVLADAQRRRVYLAVRRSERGLTKDAVAAALDISRELASFHLEKLLKAGLLQAHFERSAASRRSGAGRPAKHYVAADVDIALRIPERRYDVAAQIMMRAVAQTPSGDSPARHAVTIAHQTGREIGAEFVDEHRRIARRGPSLKDLEQLLGELGYEPRVRDRGLVLGNCPFRELVEPPYLVCEVNQGLLTGMLDGCGADRFSVEREHVDGCCGLIRRSLN